MKKKLIALLLFLSSLLGGGDGLISKDSNTGTLGLDKGSLDRCPVCGVYIFRYPRWVATIYYEKNGRLKHLAFDGVKEMMRFYFEPERWGNYGNLRMHIKKIVVRDYATLKPIVAKRAWYVAGSDIKRAGKEELIPFKSKKDAEDFKKRHGGKELLLFSDITEEIVNKRR